MNAKNQRYKKKIEAKKAERDRREFFKQSKNQAKN
jgi:hypothetical protein